MVVGEASLRGLQTGEIRGTAAYESRPRKRRPGRVARKEEERNQSCERGSHLYQMP
jgi:hypothetical protein